MKEDYAKESKLYEKEFEGLVEDFRTALNAASKECLNTVSYVVEHWKEEFGDFLEECDAALEDAFDHEKHEFVEEAQKIFDQRKHHTYGKKAYHDPYAADPYGYGNNSHNTYYDSHYTYPGYKTNSYGYQSYSNDPYAYDIYHFDDYTPSYGYDYNTGLSNLHQYQQY